jgi:hypothetical protein
MTSPEALQANPNRNRIMAGLTMAMASVALLGTAKAEAHDHSAAQRLEHRISTSQPVRYDARHDINWSEGLIQHQTELPLVANDNGEKRYFDVTVAGKSLRSVEVTELPEDVTKSPSQYAPRFHDGAQPSSKGEVFLIRDPQCPPTESCPITYSAYEEIHYSDNTDVIGKVGLTRSLYP